MNIKILRKEASFKIIRDSQFIDIWTELAQNSAEFTLIQEADLVVSWYQAYQHQYEPVLVIGYDTEDKIIGILPLALRLEDQEIMFAGDGQAEYNGWICLKKHEEAFLVNTLLSLKEQFSLAKWDWTWLPPKADMSWLQSDKLKEQGIYVNMATSELPVYDLSDTARIDKIKKSKSTKSKINRLKRSGDLRIERITDYEKAKRIFVDLKKVANFRNIAAYNARPFKMGEGVDCKEEWHLNHLENSDNVHFTVLWQGDELLACNFGFCSDDTVIIGLFTYNPVQGGHSPGNVFLIYLIDYLTAEGYKFLDLSPGGDLYKERFCNTHLAIYRPTFAFTKANKYKNDVVAYVKRKIKEKYSYRDLMDFRSKLENKLVAIKNIPKHPFKNNDEVSQLFKYDTVSGSIEDQKNSSYEGLKIRLQRYDDLLLYQEKEGIKTHKEIIDAALKNFERGDTLFTLTDDKASNKKQLITFAWVSTSGKKHWNEAVNKFSNVSLNDALIYDIFIDEKHINNKDDESYIDMSIIHQIIMKYDSPNDKNKQKKIYLIKPSAIEQKVIKQIGFSTYK